MDKKDASYLVCGALRQIVSMLTNRFLKLLKSHVLDDYEILYQILNINKKLHNYEFTDRILR